MSPEFEASRVAVPETGVWRGASADEIRRHRLPHLAGEPVSRLILRALMRHLRHDVLEITGLQHIDPARDPFVLVLNHNQRREAVVLPALMIWHRGGKRLHFFSDWNFQLYPGLGGLLRRGGVITVTAKPARPRFLNVLKPLFENKVPALTRAQRLIERGAPVGVFPEGTVNRNPERLLPGSPGAARLSLASGAPVVPGGIRFPGHPVGQPIPDRAKMTLALGPPIVPPAPARSGRPAREEVLAWHERIMCELAALSGKSWQPSARR